MRKLWFLPGFMLLFSCQSDKAASGEAGPGPSRDSAKVKMDTLVHSLPCDASEPCVQVQLQKLVLLPQDTVNARIAGHWNRVALELASPGQIVYGSRQEVADSLIAEYQRVAKEGPPVPYPWVLNQEMEVLLNGRGLLSIALQHYSFTGGAHGNNYLHYGLYRLSTGQVLPLDSLLRDTVLFKAVAEEKFRQQYDILPTASLKEAGYWFAKDRFSLPQNFSYDGNRLELIYNVYEVAPYSEGVLRVGFEGPELKKLLREEFQEQVAG